MSVTPIKHITLRDDVAINITVLCHADNSQQHFSTQAHLRIGEFLEQILEQLAQGEDAERLAQLCNNYEPVLEMVIDGEGIELENGDTLAEAGVGDNAICQIAARPLKEKLMFCRYANPA
jgi:hypothetical protein